MTWRADTLERIAQAGQDARWLAALELVQPQASRPHGCESPRGHRIAHRQSRRLHELRVSS